MRHPETDSFYDLLGVCRDATPAEIRAAFLKMAERHHPDRNIDDPEADERFKRIRRVYEVLRDPILRAAYDDHPHHFRLSDADVLGRDRGPIVSHPMPMRPASGGWAESRAGRATSGSWPTWRMDRGRASESRLAFAAAIAAMITLAAVCVLLVRASGQATSSGETSIASEILTSSAVEPLASAVTPTVSPLDQVFSSVQDLRADSANEPTDNLPPAGETQASEGAGPRRPLQLPPFNVIDDLNLPFPGWPLIIPPIDVPLFNPQRDRARDAFEPQPATGGVIEARVGASQSSWDAQSTLNHAARSAAAPSTGPHSAAHSPAPPTHAAPPVAREMEPGWSSPVARSWSSAEAGPVMHAFSDRGSLPTRAASVAGLPELPADLTTVVTPTSPFVRPIVRQLVSGLPGLPVPPASSYEDASYPAPGVPNMRHRPMAGELDLRIGAATIPNWTPPGGIRSLTTSTLLPPRAGRPGGAAQNMNHREHSLDALRNSPAGAPAWSGLPMNSLSTPGLPPIDLAPLP